MSETTATTRQSSVSASIGSRVRNAAMAGAFALVLVIPKILGLRRNPGSWMAFRVLLAITGAAVVIVPLSLWKSYLLSLVGLAMFIAAILLPAPEEAQHEITTREKARQLGALVVVNGGCYRSGNASAAPVQLFVGHENIWALDSHLHTLLAIPILEMASASAEGTGNAWLLCVRWNNHAAEFSYRGVFAEHLARVAETTLRGVMRPTLPVIPQRRAASA